MDKGLFLRSLAVQALAVAIVFGVLIALPLGDDFFEDYGMVTGPLAWIACSLVLGFGASCGGYDPERDERDAAAPA